MRFQRFIKTLTQQKAEAEIDARLPGQPVKERWLKWRSPKGLELDALRAKIAADPYEAATWLAQQGLWVEPSTFEALLPTLNAHERGGTMARAAVLEDEKLYARLENERRALEFVTERHAAREARRAGEEPHELAFVSPEERVRKILAGEFEGKPSEIQAALNEADPSGAAWRQWLSSPGADKAVRQEARERIEARISAERADAARQKRAQARQEILQAELEPLKDRYHGTVRARIAQIEQKYRRIDGRSSDEEAERQEAAKVHTSMREWFAAEHAKVVRSVDERLAAAQQASNDTNTAPPEPPRAA